MFISNTQKSEKNFLIIEIQKFYNIIVKKKSFEIRNVQLLKELVVRFIKEKQFTISQNAVLPIILNQNVWVISDNDTEVSNHFCNVIVTTCECIILQIEKKLITQKQLLDFFQNICIYKTLEKNVIEKWIFRIMQKLINGEQLSKELLNFLAIICEINVEFIEIKLIERKQLLVFLENK